MKEKIIQGYERQLLKNAKLCHYFYHFINFQFELILFENSYWLSNDICILCPAFLTLLIKLCL